MACFSTLSKKRKKCMQNKHNIVKEEGLAVSKPQFVVQKDLSVFKWTGLYYPVHFVTPGHRNVEV